MDMNILMWTYWADANRFQITNVDSSYFDKIHMHIHCPVLYYDIDDDDDDDVIVVLFVVV
jgi:hypothetical protein